MHKGAINYIIKIFLQRTFGLLLYLLGTGWVFYLRGSVYFILYYVTALFSCLVMYRVNLETLSERNKIGTNTPTWDKILLGVYWLLSFFIIYLVAGLEAKKAPAIGGLFYIGIVLVLLATALSLWALMVNTFLESTARIQNDRNQAVCKKGPYRIIRHPTYLAILIWCISMAFIFETIFICAVSVVIVSIVIIRTYFEDKMMKNELNGYKEYTQEVRYKLFPYIW